MTGPVSNWHVFAGEIDVLAVALHLQLLKIGGEACEIGRVGHDPDSLGAEEIIVPDRQEPHQHRHVALGRGGSKVLVNRAKARQHVPEILRTDGDHRREADGGIHRVASADPIPEAEHVGGVDAKLGDRLGIGRQGDEMPGYAFLGADRLQYPVARRRRVRHRLQRREGLGRDDEKRLVGIESRRRLRESRAVDVRVEADLEIRIAERPQRAIGHLRPEVGAPDADIDDRANPLPAMPFPLAGPHLVGEGRHPIENLVHAGDHVLAVDHYAFSARRPERHVQNGSVLADVDLFACEHRVAPRGDPPRPGEIEEQAHRLVGDAVLGIVEE